MLIEFAGQSARDADNVAADPTRLFNAYREPLADGRKAVKAVPGTVLFSTLTGSNCRAMAVVDGLLYVVHGGQLWTVSSAGIATARGAIPDSANTTISGNNGKVAVAAGGRYFVWDGAALEEPTPGAFSAFGSVTFLTQRTVITEQGGRRVQWSDVTDPKTLGGLSFATAEATDDNIIRAMALSSELWVFKERSIDRWYPTDLGFAPLPGATVNKGLLAYRLVAEIDTGAFFVANDGKAYLCAAGGALQKVSIPAVETAIALEAPISAFYYRTEGSEMCVLTFANRPAWCFDLTTAEWHERGVERFEPWPMRHAARAYGKSVVANDEGQICTLERVNVDHTGPLFRIAASRNFDNDGERFRVAMVKIRPRTGFTADVMLRVSNDRGMTWDAPRVRSTGETGDYGRQVEWRALGQFRNFAMEVAITDPVEVPFESVATVVLA